MNVFVVYHNLKLTLKINVLINNYNEDGKSCNNIVCKMTQINITYYYYRELLFNLSNAIALLYNTTINCFFNILITNIIKYKHNVHDNICNTILSFLDFDNYHIKNLLNKEISKSEYTLKYIIYYYKYDNLYYFSI